MTELHEQPPESNGVAEDAVDGRPAPAPPPALPDDRASILLVDDRKDKCLAMETVLADLGQNVIVAHSGKEALRLLLDRDFAVILLDVNMPGMDGFETAHLIRQRQSLEHTPIIFVTGISDTDTHVSRGYSLGAVDYILTPVLPDVLRTKVSVFVELFKKNQQLKRHAAILREAHDQLEVSVQKRTFQLAVANESLKKEISERLRAEEDIRRINAELERRVTERTAELAATNLELEAFTYSVAHDLQAPLRNIQSYIQLLEDEWSAKVPEEAAKYLTRINLRTRYMAQLIAGLLNLSMVGKQGLRQQNVDLSEIVEEIVAALKAEMPERRIDWRIQQLPVEACDPNLIRQVFANLISNAVKYSRPREEAVIEIGQATMGDESPIFIRDNGVGFDMRYADKLFGVFQRLHAVSQFEGTGIGLATVARIVRRHGGRVWAEAEETKGATFYFTLGKGRAQAA